MESETEEVSYRVELMRLREKVMGTRDGYRRFAILASLGTLFSVCAPVGDERLQWPLVLFLASMSLVFFLAYRDVVKRPRFWSLMPALLYGVPVLVASAAMVVSLVITAVSDITYPEEFLGFGGPVGMVFPLTIAIGFWSSVLSCADADLIEEHREEWLVYCSGRSMAEVRRTSERSAVAGE